MPKPDNLKTWTLTGIVATVVIILSLSIYYFTLEKNKGDVVVDETLATFVTSVKCKDCHKKEYDSWQGSHHDMAMAVADKTTVLGDFNDAEFSLHGVTSRFYTKGDKYFVHTNGPEGQMGEFEITHTFGWYPLQQYLVPFAGGRLQCLPIAWDVREKKWYRLPPEGPLDPGDWLYWTNAAQNWNGMCAECHSTNLKKNFDQQNDTYNTTWSDIDVGCEACHGPGSNHVSWAEMPEMARPQIANFELVQKTSDTSARDSVELCAPCHSRRAALGDYVHAEADLLDSMLPSLLTEELYFSDGQIMEEVYVYGSFTQSKMYRHGVRCSDCHDVHSIKPVKEGNALCLQCHRASQYDSKEHHFHKQKDEPGEPIKSAAGEVLFEVGTGAQCVQCHMPGRNYMGIDYRPDHSFRIPDPSLNAALNTPDACLRCHVDKDVKWSDETITKWYGPGRLPHYGTVIAKGRSQDPDAGEELVRLASDLLYPVIVRATALSLLAAYPDEQTNQTIEIGLMDEEALIRRTAVSTIQLDDRQKLAKLLASMLYDPVKAVGIEAASRLAGELKTHLDEDQLQVFQAVLQEFEAAMLYSADFSFGRYNLANLYGELDRPQEAISNYEAAIKIDSQFYPAKVNLAMLYNQQGNNDQAEQLLREVVESEPELYEISYSLGLLLVEMQQYNEAITYLEKAAKGLPDQARIHYNLGLLYQQLQRTIRAEKELQLAQMLEPENLDFQYGLADHYLKRGMLREARRIAEKMAATHPDNPIGSQILNYIDRNQGR
jgi:tetratricopeptide (TPR) repeat protein